MKSRKNRIRIDNLITGGLLVLIFFFTNLNVSRSTLATDFSGSGLYTLQQPSIDLVRGVDDLLKITYYHSPGLVPRTPGYVNLERQVSNVLQLYKQYGGENVRVEVVDPTDGARRAIPSGVRSEMGRKGIVPMSEKVERQGQGEPFSFYSSLEISYGANNRVVNKISSGDIANLENIITQEIQYALNPELVNIGMYIPPRMQQSPRRMRQRGSSGEPQRREDTQSFQDLETKLQDVGVVDRIFLKKGERFPDPEESDLDVLLVLGIRRMPKTDLYALDQYIMKGGKAIIAADPIGFKSSPSRMPMRRRGGERRGFLYSGNQKGKTLLKLVKQYGARGSKNVTLDKSQVRASIPVVREREIKDWRGETRTVRVRETVRAEIPFIFKAKPFLSEKTPGIINRFGQPLMMYPMSFEQADRVKGVEYQPWYSTTDQAVEYEPPKSQRPGGSALNQLHRETTQGFSIETTSLTKKKRDLVVSISGKLSSAFSADEVPETMKKGTSKKGNKGKENATGASNDGGNKKSSADSEKTADNKKNSSSDSSSGNDKKSDKAQKPKHVKRTDSGQLILTGDADMFKISQMNRIFDVLLREQSNPSPNEQIATGLVNHIGRSQKKELNLEPEKDVTPSLAPLSETQKDVFRALLIGLAPLLVVLLGLIQWGIVNLGQKNLES